MHLPPEPYVPGLTARPADEAFDGLKVVTLPLGACPAWRAGWRFFDAGYFWEAHEVWEAVWMAAPADSAERALVQGVIQLANAGLKRRMRRPKAAARLDALADAILARAVAQGGADVMGVPVARVEAARETVRQVFGP